MNSNTFYAAYTTARERGCFNFVWNGEEYRAFSNKEESQMNRNKTDVTRDLSFLNNFDNAFSVARSLGLETFYWLSVEYHTKTEAEMLSDPPTRSPEPEWDVYLAGSLRNPKILGIAKEIGVGINKPNGVFCDWYGVGPEADDHWKNMYEFMGMDYRTALQQPMSVNTYEFDKKNIEGSRTMVLTLPAGKSGHLELGWHLGHGKPGYILLDGEDIRWDVMYQFATGITDSVEELCEWLTKDLERV